ncbi:hypothetical protein Y032_0010g975 [Ancylostoma ceylanicum]|nr:hypothetical protein Y032_0010g975 [Ancylostoma ceylanicum]
MICKLLLARRKMLLFKSSYYSLFLLQSVADFYIFVFVEIIMRPRKLNYFNLFSENMKSYAVFSMANLIFSRGILCSGHIVIALNRLTAFYLPLRQERIWSSWTICLSVISLWMLCIVVSTPVIISHHNDAHFFLTQCGVLYMSGGPLGEYNSYQGAVVSVVTVAVCSACYTCSYRKTKQRKYAMVEQRLLLCAIASAVPFCIEMVRSILVLLSAKLKNDLFKTMTSLWFYEMGAIVSSSVWLQLIINKNVRDLILNRTSANQGSRTHSDVILRKMITNQSNVAPATRRISTVSVPVREKL